MAVRNVEQRKLIVELRDNGNASYRTIAKRIGISSSAIQRLYIDEKAREFKSLEWTGSLSGRAITIIKRLGLKNKEEVLAAIKTGTLTDGKGFGFITFREICAYVGFDNTGGSR